MSSGEHDKYKHVGKKLLLKLEGMSEMERIAWILSELVAMSGNHNDHGLRIDNLEDRIGLMLTRMENLEDHMGHSIGAWPMPVEPKTENRLPGWMMLPMWSIVLLLLSSTIVAVTVVMAITDDPILRTAVFVFYISFAVWALCDRGLR
jgi:hypothetical protein